MRKLTTAIAAGEKRTFELPKETVLKIKRNGSELSTQSMACTTDGGCLMLTFSDGTELTIEGLGAQV